MAKDTLLKQIRNRLDQSTYAVATAVNKELEAAGSEKRIDQSSYFRIERGDRSAEMPVAEAIARHFNVQRDLIFNPDSFRAVGDEVVAAEEPELEAKAS